MVNALKNVLLSKIQILEPDVVIERITTLFNKTQGSIDRLFYQSELVQYLEQLNSLTKLAQKLRVTSLGLDNVAISNAETNLRYVQR